MTSRLFKPWMVLALIFLAGVGTGVLLTVGLGPRFMHPPGMQIMKRHWMSHLTEKLGLTADQQAKIDPILTDATNQLQKLHHDETDRASHIMETVNSQISALLNPDQKVKLQQMDDERKQQFSGHQHSWMHSGGDGGGGPSQGQ